MIIWSRNSAQWERKQDVIFLKLFFFLKEVLFQEELDLVNVWHKLRARVGECSVRDLYHVTGLILSMGINMGLA